MTDEKTLKLIEEVGKRKREIAKLERPNWKTNCSFSYDDNSKTVNLHVEKNVTTLVRILGFLVGECKNYNTAREMLKVNTPEFTWGGYSIEDWSVDIKTRLDQIQISEKRKKLEEMERRLDSVISPELRTQMELEAIERELNE